MSTTATIAKKGCSGTGFTEDLAKLFHDQLGKTGVAVVEFVSDDRGDKRNGDERVVLSILTFEPAPTKDTEEHLRNLARAFHYERKIGEEGPGLLGDDDGPEPSVKDVVTQGQGVLVEDEDGEPRIYDPERDEVDAPVPA